MFTSPQLHFSYNGANTFPNFRHESIETPSLLVILLFWIKSELEFSISTDQQYSVQNCRCPHWALVSHGNQKEQTETPRQQDTASERWRQAEQSARASRERRPTCSIMLTTDTSVEQQQQNTKDTVLVLFYFSSPGVTLEYSSICETSCLCNSCYSTVTSNCRYVVFSSVTDCPLFAEAPGI